MFCIRFNFAAFLICKFHKLNRWQKSSFTVIRSGLVPLSFVNNFQNCRSSLSFYSIVFQLYQIACVDNENQFVENGKKIIKNGFPPIIPHLSKSK